MDVGNAYTCPSASLILSDLSEHVCKLHVRNSFQKHRISSHHVICHCDNDDEEEDDDGIGIAIPMMSSTTLC
jgi:hypothetical protein